MVNWTKRAAGTGGLALLAALLLAAPASAATVDCNGLQTALTNANPGDTIQLTPNSDCVGTRYFVSVPITLDGNGSTIDGTGDGNGGPLLAAGSGATTIKNLTMINATDSGGDGGAIDFYGAVTPTLINDRFFHDSSTTGVGGAVSIHSSTAGGTITITDSTFGDTGSTGGFPDANVAEANVGGAVAIEGIAPGTPSVVLNHDRFVGNSTNASGGAVYFKPTGANGTITITNSTFAQNNAGATGGGADLDLGSLDPGAHPQVTLTGNTVSGNTLRLGSVNTGTGAGLAVLGLNGTGALTQQSNTFNANTAQLVLGGGVITLQGGGEYVNGIPLASLDDQFTGNALTPNTNHDKLRGAGLAICNISAVAANAALTNAIVAGNTIGSESNGDGGGIWAGNCAGATATLTLRDSTVAGNTVAPGTAGVSGDTDWTLNAQNSIIAGNTGGDLSGFTSATVDHSDVCQRTAAAPGVGNICADPKLVNAAHGDVHETAASPTIDRGVNAEIPAGLTLDAYGGPRITDGLGTGRAVVDMGAAESGVRKPRPPLVLCVVPKLVGRTLAAAKAALSHAHCALGTVHSRVKTKKRRPKPKLVVVAQSRRAGLRLAMGTKINLTLGRARRHR